MELPNGSKFKIYNGDDMQKEEKLYNEKYGHIPDEKEKILEYLEKNTKLNMEKIKEEEERIKHIEWKEVHFILPIIPTPSPRPRYSNKTGTFYVKGAANNKKIIKKYIKTHDIIYTSVEMTIITYQQTPTSMSNTEIYLAEKGLVRPSAKPDWDNFGKTYSDMIQDILILNDNLITTGIVEKYYSIKPRVEICLKYQSDYDSKYNKKRTERSIAYINLMSEEN